MIEMYLSPPGSVNGSDQRGVKPLADCKGEDSEAAQSAKEAREGGDVNDIQQGT